MHCEFCKVDSHATELGVTDNGRPYVFVKCQQCGIVLEQRDLSKQPANMTGPTVPPGPIPFTPPVGREAGPANYIEVLRARLAFVESEIKDVSALRAERTKLKKMLKAAGVAEQAPLAEVIQLVPKVATQ